MFLVDGFHALAGYSIKIDRGRLVDNHPASKLHSLQLLVVSRFRTSTAVREGRALDGGVRFICVWVNQVRGDARGAVVKLSEELRFVDSAEPLWGGHY